MSITCQAEATTVYADSLGRQLTVEKIDELVAKYPECRDEDICSSMMTLVFYLNQRLDDCDHKWAAMTACQKAPKANTDREFFEGVGTLEKQFGDDPEYLKRIIAGAKREGYTPSIHDMYNPNMAQHEGDKRAFIPPTGGRGYVQAFCEERGLPCRGSTNVKGREPENDPLEKKIPLAADIVEGIRKSKIKENPDLARTNQNELRQQIVADHGAT